VSRAGVGVNVLHDPITAPANAPGVRVRHKPAAVNY
jgi:hypothetical protein